jgi:hypothetical protein
MDTAKRGVSTAAKTTVVVALVFVALGVAYFTPALSTIGGASSTTLQPVGAGSTSGSADQNAGVVALLAHFSQMDMQVTVYSGQNAYTEQQSVSYLILGKVALNSTQYTKVEFTTVGVGNSVVAWFDPQGGIYRVDVLGDRNYTGSGAYILAQPYITSFSLIPTITDNATLFSMLSKTAENTTSIGPTLVDLSTYSLAVPTAPYKSLTVMYAVLPGTSEKIAVYLHERTTDGTDTTVQVSSLTKSP